MASLETIQAIEEFIGDKEWMKEKDRSDLNDIQQAVRYIEELLSDVGSRETRIIDLTEKLDKLQAQVKRLKNIEEKAKSLFDNRLGWSDGRNPYAPPEFWANLEQALNDIDPEYEAMKADLT